jgi:hypothetical protein
MSFRDESDIRSEAGEQGQPASSPFVAQVLEGIRLSLLPRSH